MVEIETESAQSQNVITPGEYCFVIVRGICRLFLYMVGVSIGVAKLRGYAAESDKIRRDSIMSPAMERSAEAVDLASPSRGSAVDVQVGV